MPSDPYEAEILMMAEAVAHAGGKDSDSDTDVDDGDDGEHGKITSSCIR